MLDGLPRNSSVLQTLIGPSTSRGTTQVEKYRFLPPSNRQMVVFQHSSSHFDALTCTLRLRTRSRMCMVVFQHSSSHFDASFNLHTEAGRGRGCAWDIKTHTQSLQKKGYGVVFQHSSSHFGCALTCTLRLDEVEDVRDIQTHTQSLYGTKKGYGRFSNTLARTLMPLTRNTEVSTVSRMRGHSTRTTVPLRNKAKGVSPVRERPSVTAEVAYTSRSRWAVRCIREAACASASLAK
ncbi:hypothetical protein TNIN_242231 [Trichonephila inaurata madagascariensis]|uniref:Uncharacterized protein n=1 Tax=Trichonephila inaurata madagascariensis TaxID=2747483 RepID=A0A8X7C8W0_9ARAC|nr:hypothetical protein TNIN_242231 [Trichonephila inaurata madagascariensis]